MNVPPHIRAQLVRLIAERLRREQPGSVVRFVPDPAEGAERDALDESAAPGADADRGDQAR